MRWLPWLVASVLFMEQLDSTIVNTAVPAMARSLEVTPLSLKAIVTSYILALAVGIPVSGWLADRFGTRRVFSTAVTIFTVASILCGLSTSLPMLVASRVLQGLGAAMMTPVGRLALVRTFPKSQLLVAMNFVIIPALIGPLLGPTVGGLIVHWFSWREIFFVNVPVGIVALWLTHKYMPDYRATTSRRLDVLGLVLFASGAALLTWLFDLLGDQQVGATSAGTLALLSIAMLTAYVFHARRATQPLLDLALLKIRTFRVSVGGGLIARLGFGGLPFLIPLFLQLGLGKPAWLAGLLMMPGAIGAMAMKAVSPKVLRRFGFRRVLTANTLAMGVTIGLFTQVGPNTPLIVIVVLGLIQGAASSMQFSSMNSLAFADIDGPTTSMATSIAAAVQQLSMSFGLAFSSLLAGWFLGDLAQTDQVAVTRALHLVFLALGVITAVSSLAFSTLQPNDGRSLSGHVDARAR